MTHRLILALAVSTAIPVGLMAQETPAAAAPAAEAPVLSPEQQAVANRANVFIEAYNKADLKTLASLFAEDAEWVDDGGNVIAGRAAITDHFKDVFAASKGRTLTIDVESLRPLTADVMLEKGTSTVTDPDGRNAVSSYTAAHVKKGDAWLISQFTETGSPLAGSAARQLAELEWLVGSWEDASDNLEATSTIEWALDNNYLTWTYNIKGTDGDDSRGTQVIGWDPSLGKIRSWAFDSDGGFSEKVWTQDGRRWLIQTRSVLPDGGQGTEEQSITFVDKDKFTWSSASRQVDGEALPNIGAVTVVRSK
jgi:uncharacterized protein (TIGR02246 family)